MKKKASKPKPADFRVLKKIERLEKKIDKLTLANKKKSTIKQNTSTRKPSKYNLFVKKGLKQGKSFKDIAKDWSKK